MSLYDIYQKRNEKLRKLGYNSYQDYLSSLDWQKIKNKLKWECCHFCKECDTQLDKHHNSYRDLGTQKTRDIIVVCRGCHGNLHCLASCHLFKAQPQPLRLSYKIYQELIKSIKKGDGRVIDFLESKHILRFLIGEPLLRVTKSAKIKRRLKVCK